ncbi:hypothetical protein FO519_001392 [Halicephalobus sp. NKZ332]|nr:hypothetical protein FO519_001392 [Halicephalobus sp. NKZ332]
MEQTHSGVVVYLHPIVALGISDQWTRKKMNSTDSNVKVFGFITGKHEGLKVEIVRSHILVVEEKMDDGVGALRFDEDFFTAQRELAKEMFPHEDILGWYVTSGTPRPDSTEIQLNNQFSKVPENPEHPLLLKFDAEKLHATGNLTIEILETVVDLEDDTKTLFRKMPMQFETEPSELISLEHMASFSASGDYYHTSSSKLISSLAVSMNALHQRIKVCISYVKAVISGELPKNEKVLSDIFKLCLRLKALQSHPSLTNPDGSKNLTTSSKQISCIASITALQEDLKNMNEILGGMFSHEPHSRRSGLFGNPLLTSPESFHKITKEVISEAQDLVEQIVSHTGPPGRPTVALVDDLSNVICCGADVAECVRNVHSDKKFATAANDCMRDLTNLVETLNTNYELFSALKKSAETEKNQLDEVDKRTLALLISDFEQSGVHLPDSERITFVNLSNEIFEAATEFSNGVYRPSLVSKEEQKEYGVGPVIETPYPVGVSPSTREFFFKRYYHHFDEQEKNIQKLIGARHKLANLTGFGSFSDRSQMYSVLGSYENARNFLHGLIETFSDTIEPEIELARNTLKVRKEITGEKKMNEWDFAYGSALFRQQCFGFTGSLSKYFHFETLLSGFETLVDKLYGINFDITVPLTGEVWDGNVVKVEVKKSKTFLGVIYIDLDNRPSKLTGDCHYTVRCAKQLASGDFQTPIVVLSLNIADPKSALENVTMSPSTAETFFHEMGHAIHSMLGRTRYQHTAGTRCPTDIAEVPSHLMEFFFNDPRILKMICKDSSGREIDPEAIEALIASRSLFSGMETLQQTHYSLFDLEAHGPEYAPLIAEGKMTSTRLFYELGRKCVPLLERNDDVAWPQRFGHLGPYGAKYYSYLVAKAASSMIWNKNFKNDPFNHENGKKWAEVQSYGGELPSGKLLSIALGKEPDAKDLSKALHDNYSSNNKLLEEYANE